MCLNTSRLCLFTIVSLLADTANILEESKRELFGSAFCDGVAIIATMDDLAYSSIPQRIIEYHHQWMDFIASVAPSSGNAEDDGTHHSEWNLVFKTTGLLEPLPKVSGKRTVKANFSFDLKVRERFDYSGECRDRGPTHTITWRV